MPMKTAFLFPGQGSQEVGMGKAFALSSQAAAAVWREADDVLGFSLSRLCFEGPPGELTLTANTQPAVLTTSVAAAAALAERGVGLSPHRRRRLRGEGEGFPHPDFLGALPGEEKGGLHEGRYQRRRAAAQVKPPPKAAMSTRSPGLTRLVVHASSSAT